jgi:ketosteroid isomerase-like protein
VITRTEMTRRALLRTGAVGAGAGIAAFAVPGLAQASNPDSEQIGEIYQLQADFHRAKSHQNIDLMVSLWAPDATFHNGGATFTGQDAVRTFFLGSGSWHHQRISFVPSFKDQINVRGDTAFLYFECHDVALTDESPTVAAGTIVTHLYNAGTIRNVKGKWLFQDMFFGSAAPLSVDHIYYP